MANSAEIQIKIFNGKVIYWFLFTDTFKNKYLYVFEY